MGKAKRTKSKLLLKSAQRQQPEKSPWEFAARTRALIMSVVPFLAIFLVARTAVAEAFRIPSGSMEPTMLVGDWLFVNKLRFGPHIPFTRHSLPGYAQPHRGDVAVFVSPPQDPSIRISPDEITPLLVKRIVGVAGDTLVMRHGELQVNGVVAPRPNTTFTLPDSIADAPQAIFDWQHSVELRGSRFGEPTQTPSVHEWGPLVVPTGTFFMMGDNRDDSVDSRYYGVVPRANIRGTPMFVYYSYDTEAGSEYVRAFTAIRWSRLGTWIR